MMTAPKPTPTPIAAGRLRPAREAGAEGALIPLVEARSSDLEQLGFLVLDQVVDLGDVPVGDRLQLLLGAGDVVLAHLAVLGQLVQGVLRAAADVADGHARLLALVPGG